jgi:hypothetical protein
VEIMQDGTITMNHALGFFDDDDELFGCLIPVTSLVEFARSLGLAPS